MKNHQKFKTALKWICLCLVTVAVAVGVSSNYIWPIAPLHWKGAHHSPRDAKHKGAYFNLPISGSINHDLLTTFGSLLSSSPILLQPWRASSLRSIQPGPRSLWKLPMWHWLTVRRGSRSFLSSTESPDMVINHSLTDRALNCLEMKLHIPIQGSPSRTWNLFHLCVIKKWSTLGERINPNFRFIKVSLLCLIKSVLKPPNPKLKT